MKYILSAFLFVFLFSACSKDDADPVLTSVDKLSSGAWKFDEGGIDNDQNGTIDLVVSVGLLDPCIADNTVNFANNGTGIADEGPTKCDPAASQTTSFTYTLSNNDKQLNISGINLLNLGGSFEITELSPTRLGLSKDTVMAPFPTPVSLIVYLKH